MGARLRIFYSSLFMLISPLGALIYGLSKNNSKSFKRWILTIFSTVYASTFAIEGIGDGTRHWQNVYDYYLDLSFTQFWVNVIEIITFKKNSEINEDLYIHFLSYFTGTILGAPALFFVFVGLVYGYFFAGSILKLFDSFPNWKKNTGIFIIAVYFICILNLQSMNTVRTWTGFWVMFYGVLQYQDTRKLKYLLLVLSGPIFHIGYFIMALPVWAGLFFRWNKNLLFGIYLLSFAGNLFSSKDVVQQLNQTEVGQEKVQGYYREDKSDVTSKIEAYSKSAWYKAYKKSGLTDWGVTLIAIFFVINGDFKILMNSKEKIFFSIGLLSKTLSNSTWFLYALSTRSGLIADLFILASIILYWQRMIKNGDTIIIKLWLRPIWTVGLLLIFPVFFYYLSNTLEYLSAYIIAFPFIAWIDDSFRITIRALIGLIIN